VRRLILAAAVIAAAGQFATLRASAAPTIDVRFSVKVILRPQDHQRPAVDAAGGSLTDAKVGAVFDIANDSLLSAYWRGYRFALVEILNVGTCTSGCDSSDPSFWSDAALTGDFDMKRFEYWAKLYPAFLWRTNAVNIYINAGKGDGAVASFPPPDNRSNDVVFIGSRVFDPANRRTWASAMLHHEMGHYFSLPHPNGTVESCCVPSCITDGDLIEDTLPDAPCFTLDQLSTYRYGAPFSGVNAVKQDSLLDMFWNNMCYLHPDQKDDPGEGFGHTLLDRLTELQLDHWTDAANGVRANVRAARTRFVELQGACPSCPTPTGKSTDPYRDVPQALANAASGDILLIRPGTYSGPSLISQPVTLRATRRGAVRIMN
jgi:hypothetical protein